MPQKRALLVVGPMLVGVCSAVSACDVDNEETGTVTTPLTASLRRPAEEPLLAIASKVPSFAGYYCDGGDLVVESTLPTGSQPTETLLNLPEIAQASFYCRTRSLPNHVPGIVAQQVRTDFMALRQWRDTLEESYFGIDGARSVEIDYKRNSIVLGVIAGHEQPVRDLILSQAVPVDSVVVEPTDTPQLAAFPCPAAPYNGTYLGDCFRPIPGGVQMQAWTNGGGSYYTAGTMTLAAPRWSSGIGAYQNGFVTCSHCVPGINTQDNDWVSQPQSDAVDGTSHLVAIETVDAPGYQCGSNWCKNSDSAWLYDYSGSVDSGTVARTLFWNGTQASCNRGDISCTIDASDNRFRVYRSVAPVAINGMEVEKMGNNSGWTTGTVETPCKDLLDYQGDLYVCNTVTTLPSWGGDSGSPVFYWWSWALDPDTVELVGVLWGTDATDTHSWVSPWDNVTADLGTLDIRDHAPFLEWAALANVRPVAGDFNNDQRTDIALLGGFGWSSIPVAFSQGDGSFVVTNAPVSNFATWAATAGVRFAVGDVDHDGRDDIILAGASSWASIPVAFSNGDGTFRVTNVANSVLPGLAAGSTVKVMSGDVNGDLKRDLILVGGSGWTSIWVGISDGLGGFAEQSSGVANFPAWASAAGVQAVSGDFDHNGLADIALAGGSAGRRSRLPFDRPTAPGV